MLPVIWRPNTMNTTTNARVATTVAAQTID
jgi:hypothetical protein